MSDDSLNTSESCHRGQRQAEECGRDETPTLTEMLGGDGSGPGVRDRASLTVLTGDDTGRLIRLGDAELIVGRGADVHLRLADASVSLRHAKLFRVEDHVYVQDLHSRHGTFVGGKKIDSPVRLGDGDQVQIGLSRILRFNLNSSAEEEAAEQLYESAVRDPTSGAYNRRHLERQLEAERTFARHRGRPFALLLLDIDEFKPLNDTYGHVLGDVVLRIVAASVQRLLRPEDTLVRFGGDEFVVLCRDTNLRNGLILAERIRASVERLPCSVRGNDIHVTVSVGVASAPSDDAAWGSLVGVADQALYRAKRGGRNSVACSGDGDRPESAPQGRPLRGS